MRRNARANWRRLVQDLSNDQRKSGAGLWRLLSWSKRAAGKPHADSRIPALRRNENETAIDDDTTRAEIFAEKFFPRLPEQDMRGAGEKHTPTPLRISQTMTKGEVESVLKALPSGKAPGPDRIPNEVLKALAPEISKGLA